MWRLPPSNEASPLLGPKSPTSRRETTAPATIPSPASACTCAPRLVKAITNRVFTSSASSSKKWHFFERTLQAPTRRCPVARREIMVRFARKLSTRLRSSTSV